MNIIANKPPVVSVWMITYNHESFIAQAIEGVLMQKTNFKIELVIGEDCSTDKTANIIRNYAAKHPDLIKARFNSPNIGMMPNMVETLQECTGKYIALCEGDDYWTDPFKLQKQIDYLEKNPDFIGIGNDVYYQTDCDSIVMKESSHTPIDINNISLKTLVKQNVIPTCSILFRNIGLKLPDTIKMLSLGDWPLILLLSQYGQWGISSEKMAVYRIHEGGVWSNSKLNRQKTELNKLSFYNFIFDEIPLYRRLTGEPILLILNNLLSIDNSTKLKCYFYLKFYQKQLFTPKNLLLSFKILSKLFIINNFKTHFSVLKYSD